MPKASDVHGSMTDLLRQAIRQAPSVNGVAVRARVQKTSLIRFLRGDQTLRLDMAERLADYLGIECVWRKDK